MTEDFDIYFQRVILARAFKDPGFRQHVIRNATIQHFETEALQWLFRRLVEGVGSLPVLIDKFKQACEQNRLTGALREATKTEIGAFVKSKDFDDAKYGLQKLNDFVRKKRLTLAILQATKALKKNGDVAAAERFLLELDTRSAESRVDTTNVVTSAETRQAERAKAVADGLVFMIKTGLKQFDEDVGGIELGQLWAWFGDTNIGKSSLAVAIGLTAVLYNYMVWHISLEDTHGLTLQRYDAAMTRIDSRRLKDRRMSEAELARLSSVISLMNQRRPNHLFLSTMPESSNMGEIEREYNRIRNYHGFSPQLILLDTPYCMEPTTKEESKRFGYKRIYQEMRSFVRANNVAMHVFDQTKQEMKGKIADTGASSESYDKARIVDGFITINQTRQLKKEGLIQLYVPKMKDREKEQSYLIRPKRSIMLFESVEA